MIFIQDEDKLKHYVNKFCINDLFSGDMRKYMSLYMWKSGEHICREGEKLEYLFFIVKGKAKVYKNFENGKSLLLCFYNPLKMVGDVEFTRTNIADCSVQAINDIYAVGMKIKDVREALLTDCIFLRNICEYLGKKLTVNSTNFAINMLYPLENRLASYILAFLNCEDDENENNINEQPLKNKSKFIKFKFEGNYMEIADLLGTSYRHLNRVLNKMCLDNIISKHGKSYCIVDFEKLKELSGELYK